MSIDARSDADGSVSPSIRCTVQIEQLRAQLHRASPSPQTRALLRVRTISEEVQWWSLRTGRLVILDEASMAGWFELDALTVQARNAGAKVLQLRTIPTNGAVVSSLGTPAGVAER